MKEYKVVTLTHQAVGIRELGKWVLPDDKDQKGVGEQLQFIKDELELDEMMYLATCNRITFLFTTQHTSDARFLQKFFNTVYSHLPQNDRCTFIEKGRVFEGEEAVEHILHVASSLDSMVLGEREIYKQLKDAYKQSKEMRLSGDSIRLLMERALVTAKRIFTETEVARRPVSVASLAVSTIVQKDVPTDANILIVGAGQTNNLVAKYLKKYGFQNVSVFNRSKDNALALAARFNNGRGYLLDQLQDHTGGFDVLIACTASSQPTVTQNLFSKIAENGGAAEKNVIDLGVPADVESPIAERSDVNYTSVEEVRQIADQNLAHRQQEKEKALQIVKDDIESFQITHKQRQVEKALGSIPNEVTSIKQRAIENVFRKEIDQMDENSKEVLEKVVNYLEKKYISIPMSVAKEELIKRELLR